MNGRSKTLVLKNYKSIGLGDRLYCLAMAMCYAKASGRALCVDWSDGTYSAPGENAFSNLFSLTGYPSHDVADLQDNDIFPQVWRERLTAPHPLNVSQLTGQALEAATRPYEIEYAREYSQQVLVWSAASPYSQLKNFIAQKLPTHRNMPEREAIRSVLNDRLIANPEIVSQVNAFKQAHFSTFNIGVHIRHTHESVELRSRRGDFHAALQKAMRTHPNAKLFIATDSHEIQCWLQKKYPASCFVDKQFRGKSEALHHSSENRTEHAKAALMDLLLLSACDYLIYPQRSTFSTMAANLSSVEDSRLIAIPSYYEKLYGWLHRLPMGARLARCIVRLT